MAGHLGLDNLCWVYDNNHISIEGNTRITFTEDVTARFLGYDWNVLRVGDANDIERIQHALQVFRLTKGRPTLIVLDSHIGYGSPNRQDTAAAHGEPLGPDEVRLTKRAYGWPEDAQFLVPTGCVSTSPRGSARAERRRTLPGRSCLLLIERSIPNWRRRSIRCNVANCRPDGIAIYRRSLRIPKGWQAATRPAKC